ncbi:MAG TPA: VOC family protein [Alphaproteobacteria bacterium]|nr:VOC family protein [Alphaproteobacteria bacterium]
MSLGIRGIDHPVIAIRDMAQGRRTYERLGFTVPPRGSHLEWGTGNWCIMFASDYLELRGVVDAGRYLHHLDEFLAVREGLMGVAFDVADAAASFEKAVAAGVAAMAPRELTRRFELAEGDTFPRFRLVFLGEGAAPGLAGALMIQHMTPQLLRRPEWLEHPNGAVAVQSLTAVVQAPRNARGAFERLFGHVGGGVQGAIAVRLERDQGVELVSPPEAVRRGLALPGVSPPYMAALALRVRDLARTATVLAKNGVPFERPEPRRLRVGPEQSCGIICDFVADAHG